jgi:ribosomal protein L37AE/L43A
MDDTLTECYKCGKHAKYNDETDMWYCMNCGKDLEEQDVIEYCKPCCSGH